MSRHCVAHTLAQQQQQRRLQRGKLACQDDSGYYYMDEIGNRVWVRNIALDPLETQWNRYCLPISSCAEHHIGRDCFHSTKARCGRTCQSSSTCREDIRTLIATEDDDGDDNICSNEFAERDDLFWTLLPPHMVRDVIQTPDDAALILQRLKEEAQMI